MTIHGLLRVIIRNDAIKIDPPEIYNWRVIALAASVGHPHLCRTAYAYMFACKSTWKDDANRGD